MKELRNAFLEARIEFHDAISSLYEKARNKLDERKEKHDKNARVIYFKRYRKLRNHK